MKVNDEVNDEISDEVNDEVNDAELMLIDAYANEPLVGGDLSPV